MEDSEKQLSEQTRRTRVNTASVVELTLGVTMQLPEIRKERSTDCGLIRAVTEVAFREMPFSDGDEQDVIDRLRSAKVLSLSLVAVIEEKVVGHIAFSPARAGDESCPWFALGPVSVLPDLQRQGVGSTLIESGLGQIEDLGALGCILTGNPEYYRRFGFALSPKNVPPNEPEEFFMLKLFKATQVSGPISFHKAFYGDV